MLVVISDLHLVDETAGHHNVQESAYRLWLEHILDLAETQSITELVFVYLGDIFDLIRSEQWLAVPMADRPWGDPEINGRPLALSEACRAVLHDVIDRTAVVARAQLDALAGRGPDHLKKRLEALGVPVRRVFIPGNHDRLYCIDPDLKEKVDNLLGVATRGVEGVSLHSLISPKYGVIARHGHEFDLWNYEGRRPEPGEEKYAIPDEDFLKVPIGDLITTELTVRLPAEVKLRMAERGMSPDVVDRFYRRLQEIQDVRPVYAAVQWTYYKAMDLRERGPGSTSERMAASEIIEEAVQDVFAEFMRLPFTRAWLDSHDKWTHPLDEADKLQALNLLLRGGVGLGTMQTIIRAFNRLGLGGGQNPQRAGAAAEPILRDRASGIHYAVYGHTHRYEQVPLGDLDGQEQIYFNSGTWRPRVIQALNGSDFAEWKEITYLIFYNKDEDPPKEYPLAAKGLSFETWTGTMLKRRRDLPDAPLAS